MPPIQTIPPHQIPTRLHHISPKPRALYGRGTLPDFDAYKCLAVVGSRAHTQYGHDACKALIEGLVGYPIMIVSGLAIGVDSLAHETALDAGLLTVAVPGSSLADHELYPRTKVPLAHRIVKSGGCLLSEYAVGEPTGPWSFPERNRIMAGLADAVLIIEATAQSGTSITARLALDFGKDVFVVPGSIFSPLSKGPHTLMKQGAQPVTCSRDIIEALGLSWHTEHIIGDDRHQDVRDNALLAHLPCTKETLITKLGEPAHVVQSRLSLLEINGIIREHDGILYIV